MVSAAHYYERSCFGGCSDGHSPAECDLAYTWGFGLKWLASDVCSQKQTMHSDGLGSDSTEEGDHYGDNREETLIVEYKKST